MDSRAKLKSLLMGCRVRRIYEGSSFIDRCLERKYGIGFSQAFQEVEKSKVARQSQIGEVQNFTASQAERPSNSCSLGGSTVVRKG